MMDLNEAFYIVTGIGFILAVVWLWMGARKDSKAFEEFLRKGGLR